MTTKNYKTFSYNNGLIGFRGNEFDFIFDKTIKLLVYQTNFKEELSSVNPSLKIILRSSINNHFIQYNYFFNNSGEFISGFSTGTNANTRKSFPSREQNNFDCLVLHGNSIQNILSGQEIPKELSGYKIIEALKNNSINELYKQ